MNCLNWIFYFKEKASKSNTCKKKKLLLFVMTHTGVVLARLALNYNILFITFKYLFITTVYFTQNFKYSLNLIYLIF